MPAELIVINNVNPDMNLVIRMANALRNGKLVVLPTETVYGLAANSDHPEAMKRLTEIKNRSDNSPFTLHLYSHEQLHEFVPEISIAAEKLAEKYWPGPMTLVFPKIGKCGLGVRVVNSPVTQMILKFAEVPVVATSANRRNETPALSGFEANQKLGKYVDYIVEAGFSQLQASSSVILIGNQTYKIARDSLIGKTNIHETINRKIYFLCDANRIRSVFAHAFMLKLMMEEGKTLFGSNCVPIIDVDSAGLFAIKGEEMLEGTQKVLVEQNAYQLVKNHRSKAFNPAMLEIADEIYVMTKRQLKQTKEYNPALAHKVKLLHHKDKDIADPIRKSIEAHRKIANQILESIIERFFYA